MTRFPEPSDPEDWQPATSRPGELFTIEGQSRARWAMLKGLKNRDPRFVSYRNSMIRTGATIAAGGVLLVAIIVAIDAAI
jgi:hypothetical protein